MNTSIRPRTKTLASFKKSLIILLFFSCCFAGILSGQTSDPLPPKGAVASIDLPDAYDPHRQMKKVEKELKNHPLAKKTLKLNKAQSSKLTVEVLPNSCTQKLEIAWEGDSCTAGFSLVNADGHTFIPKLTINKGSRLEFDLPVGNYLILLQIEDERHTQKISVY